jgi:hypothetical protein
MIDAAKTLRDYLLTQTALTTLNGTRLWAEVNEPPEEAHYKPTQGAAIVFKSAGGPGLEAGDTVLAVRWQFKVYGVDVYGIRNTYLALTDVLHDVRAKGGILSSSQETPGTMLQEPDTQWLFCLTYFQTRMRSRLPIPV